MAYKRNQMKGRTKQKLRKNNFRKFLSLILISAAIVTALILFFRLDTVRISGNEKYTEEEIIQIAQIEMGSNLFLLNKYEISQNIYQQLPYIEEAYISRKLPSTLKIEIKECKAEAYIPCEDGSWLISGEGKILEKVTDAKDYPSIPLVKGCNLLYPNISETIVVPEAESEVKTALLAILDGITVENLEGLIEEIDLSESSQITLKYLERFSVKIPWNSDYAYKIKYLAKVVEKLEANETGVIDLTMEKEAHFIPYYEEETTEETIDNTTETTTP